jgi:hypothetical protein
MFANPSLTTRIAIGKGLGALFGIAGFVYLTVYPVGDDGLLRWGILLWYTTLGAIVGMFGVYTWHPILKLPMPWWFRAPVVGAWLNFVLVFFAYDSLTTVLEDIFGVDGPFTSPFWFTAEGAIIGLIIGFVATRFGGEGPETVTQPAGAD